MLPAGPYHSMQGPVPGKTLVVFFASKNPVERFWHSVSWSAGQGFLASLILISLHLHPKRVASFPIESCYLAMVGNQEQQQELILFWGPLGPL